MVESEAGCESDEVLSIQEPQGKSMFLLLSHDRAGRGHVPLRSLAQLWWMEQVSQISKFFITISWLQAIFLGALPPTNTVTFYLQAIKQKNIYGHIHGSSELDIFNMYIFYLYHSDNQVTCWSHWVWIRQMKQN